MADRIDYDEKGYLDEAVVTGTAHIERMRGGKQGKAWFLAITRPDGSEWCCWINGRIGLIEERPAPGRTANA
jgi:hypothetical protein